MKDLGDRPFFSIIVPTYNRGNILPSTLRSILNQEFSNFEVIVVDDGSTDDTKEIVKQIAEKDSRINYFFKKNEERSIARNFGILKSSGVYVAFLDSDDILYPNHFMVAFNLMEKNNLPEVGVLGSELIDGSGKSILVRNNFDRSFAEELIHENKILSNAILIRRDIALTVNFIPSKDAILSEDWYLWLRLAARYQFHFDNTITSAAVQHNARSLENINPDRLIASTNIVVEYLKKDAPFLKAYRGKVNYHFANHYTFVALILALTKERRLDTLKYLLRSIGYDPTVIFRKRFLASVKHLF